MKMDGRGTPLGPLRLLDLGGIGTLYCSRLLADLGATVVKVEPPEGHPLRRLGPFADTPFGPRSLPFAYYAVGTRSVALDVSTAAGRDRVCTQVQEADVVVEAFPPGYLTKLGLGYPRLRAWRPGLVHLSITPFGETGPWRTYASTDATAQALGGVAYLTGYADGPPLSAGGLQSYVLAGLFGACLALAGVARRRVTGRGCHIDLSIHECLASALESHTSAYAYNGVIPRRRGSTRPEAFPTGVYPCRDGYWCLIAVRREEWLQLVLWMQEDGLDIGDLLDPVYSELSDSYLRRRAQMERINRLLMEFGRRRTKQEIFRQGAQRGIAVAPVCRADEVLADPHLRARRAFAVVQDSELGLLVYPRPAFRFSRARVGGLTPAPPVSRNVPARPPTRGGAARRTW